jgi:hypothetical protein
MTVRVTDELSTQPRANQRGFQDDKSFTNTFLQTSPRCAALAVAPSSSCGTCASGDGVLLRLQRGINRAAQRHARLSRCRVARAAAAAEVTAGRHGCAIYGPLRALGGPSQGKARRRIGAGPPHRHKPNERTDTQTNIPLCARHAAPSLVRQCRSGSAHTHTHTHTLTFAHAPTSRTQTHAYTHQANTQM